MLLFAVLGITCAPAAEPKTNLSAVFRAWSEASQERGREGIFVRALQPLVGPLREDCLTQRFRWTTCSSTELEAVPVDPHEAMFVPCIRITLDRDAMPSQVTIGQVTRDIRELVRTDLARFQALESSASQSNIVAVSFEEPTPATKPVDAHLKQVLCCWIKAAERATAVRSTFRRVDYDFATEVEFHSSGEFVFAAPRTGYYRSVPTNHPSKSSTRIGIQGKPFVQLPGEAISHYWTDRELFQINSASRSYFSYALPKTGRNGLGIGSFDNLWRTLMTPQSSLPFVAGLNEKELTTDFEWQLVSESAQAITLEGHPVSGPDVANYGQVQVILDPKTYRTRATRVTDPGRTRETIHQFFDQVVSNDPKSLGNWQPDLTGLTLANDPSRLAGVPPVEPAAAEPAHEVSQSGE